MKILLINPPFDRFKSMITPYFPIGLSYLGSVLSEKGNELAIYDVEKGSGLNYLNFYQRIERHDLCLNALRDNNNEVWSEIGKTIEDFRPGLVGISAASVKYQSALKVASICKGIDPGINIVFGGPHPTITPESIAKQEDIDFIVCGEGEYALLDLVDELKQKGNTLKTCSNTNKIYNNRRLGVIKNLDDLPFPDRDLFLNKHLFTPDDFGTMITSRGCPFECTYCVTKNIWGKAFNQRSVKNVISEMEYIIENYGTIQFSFVDDVFTLNRKWALDFSSELMKRGINKRWSIVTRFDLLDDELIKLMKEAGCNYIRVGVESFSDRILKSIKRRMGLETILKGAEMLHRHDIFWGACFIIGFPDETEEDIQRTMKLMKKIRPHYCTISLYTPYPGTTFFDEISRKGYFSNDEEFSRFEHHSPYNYFSNKIPKERYKSLIFDIIKGVDDYNNIPQPLRESFFLTWRAN